MICIYQIKCARRVSGVYSLDKSCLAVTWRVSLVEQELLTLLIFTLAFYVGLYCSICNLLSSACRSLLVYFLLPIILSVLPQLTVSLNFSHLRTNSNFSHLRTNSNFSHIRTNSNFSHLRTNSNFSHIGTHDRYYAIRSRKS
jgi:hypothetical protein